MSEFSAKTLREKRKEKAARMGSADPSKKVDSSDWTPPEPLNADVKTGARPISRRAFKSGGKVCGEKAKANMGRAPRKSGGVAAKDYANAKVNRNVKDANEEREGIKHVGGFKKGGRTNKRIGGALEFLSPALMVANAIRGDKDKDEKKHGGRTKRQYGGRGPGERTQHEIKRRDAVQAATDYGADPRVTESQLRDKTRAFEKSAEQTAYKKGGRTKKADGGPLRTYQSSMDEYLAKPRAERKASRGKLSEAFANYNQSVSDDESRPQAARDLAKARLGKKDGDRTKKNVGGPMGMMPDPRLSMVSPTAMKFSGAQGTPYKRGGKVHSDEAMDKALIKKMVKPSARTGKADGGEMDAPKPKKVPSDYNEESVDRAIASSNRAGRKISSGEAKNIKSLLGGWRERVNKYGRKDGGAASREGRATGGKVKKGKTNINIIINAGKKDDGGVGMPPPPPGLPGGPMSLQRPMGGMPPGMPGMPLGAPAGGPPSMGQPPMPPMARKAGGRVTKVAKSYKDMEAGAGSGEGRLQKTDIAKRNPKPKEDGVILTKDRGYPNKVLGATGGRTAHKAGGKVYRSYKDMDAGAGSGEGRLEKTEIAKKKR